MYSSSKGEGFSSINNGEIVIGGNRKAEAEYGALVGMKADKLVEEGVTEGEIYMLNKGKITVNNNDFDLINPKSPYSVEGMAIVAFDSKSKNTIENTGTINVSGKYASGMESYGENTFAINRGVINVDGELAVGMNSLNGSIATNEKEGVINVKGINSYGKIGIAHV